MRFRSIRRVGTVVCCLLMMTAGCSWQRVPPPPSYGSPPPLPLVVGVQLPGEQADEVYGPRVVALLKEMEIFQYVIWPYQPDTPVDAVLELSIHGNWSKNRGSNVVSALLVGLTLGLLGPFLGASISGVHDVDAGLLQADDELVRYSFQIESKVSRGLGSSPEVLLVRAGDLQTRKIAVTLANRLDTDRARIMDFLSNTSDSGK